MALQEEIASVEKRLVAETAGFKDSVQCARTRAEAAARAAVAAQRDRFHRQERWHGWPTWCNHGARAWSGQARGSVEEEEEDPDERAIAEEVRMADWQRMCHVEVCVGCIPQHATTSEECETALEAMFHTLQG